MAVATHLSLSVTSTTAPRNYCRHLSAPQLSISTPLITPAIPVWWPVSPALSTPIAPHAMLEIIGSTTMPPVNVSPWLGTMNWEWLRLYHVRLAVLSVSMGRIAWCVRMEPIEWMSMVVVWLLMDFMLSMDRLLPYHVHLYVWHAKIRLITAWVVTPPKTDSSIQAPMLVTQCLVSIKQELT